MRVALIHYWLTKMRGGERVLEAFARMFPDADIYTHVYDRSQTSDLLAQHQVQTTFISKFPFAKTQYQKLLPFMPRALEELDLSQYDLVISSESGPAKGVIPNPNAFHLCYCHSPMRYIWDLYPQYHSSAGRLSKLAFPGIAHRLRTWDVTSAARVDQFVANSNFVARRIEKYYRRPSEVIHPPINVSEFAPDPSWPLEDFYLVAGELVRYKRFDIVVDAFTRLGKPLVVMGDGEDLEFLKKRAGPNVRFVGRVPFGELKRLFATCKALVFAGEEDFGMIPVEVMASGRPVIAFAQGGSLDTVKPGVTGVLVKEQSVDAFCDAVEQFDPQSLSSDAIIEHASSFSTEVFEAKIRTLLAQNGLDITQTESR